MEVYCAIATNRTLPASGVRDNCIIGGGQIYNPHGAWLCILCWNASLSRPSFGMRCNAASGTKFRFPMSI
jgi:hypothetical protein